MHKVMTNYYLFLLLLSYSFGSDWSLSLLSLSLSSDLLVGFGAEVGGPGGIVLEAHVRIDDLGAAARPAVVHDEIGGGGRGAAGG